MISPRYDSIDDFDDIESKNKYAELCQTVSPEEALARINFGSRDNTRHPMCWDDSEFGGFSQTKPWIATHSMVRELNLKNDLASEKSVYRFYQALLKTRSTYDALTLGNVSFLSKPEDNFMITLREYEGEKVLIVCNFEQGQTINTGFDEGQPLLTNGDAQLNGYYGPFEIGVYRV